jgi:hypothetical protein
MRIFKCTCEEGVSLLKMTAGVFARKRTHDCIYTVCARDWPWPCSTVEERVVDLLWLMRMLLSCSCNQISLRVVFVALQTCSLFVLFPLPMLICRPDSPQSIDLYRMCFFAIAPVSSSHAYDEFFPTRVFWCVSL